MNKNYLINDGIISIVDFVNVSKKGVKSINTKYSYILNVVIKALNLKSIGCNFVVNTEYKHDYVKLNNNTSVKHSNYDKTNNTMPLKDFVNVLNMVNLFLEDRQILARHNDKENLIVQVVNSHAKLEKYYKREKNAQIVTTVKTYDLVTDTITETEEKTKNNLSFINDNDIQKIWASLKACDGVLKDSSNNTINFTSNIKKLESSDKKDSKKSNIA